MVGMVDSEHVVFVGRDAEEIGEPTEGNEIERMEWVPRLPRYRGSSMPGRSGTPGRWSH